MWRPIAREAGAAGEGAVGAWSAAGAPGGPPAPNRNPRGGRGGGGLRPRLDVPWPRAREGDAEKGDPGIGAGKDKAAQERPPLGPEHVVLAPERDDPDLGAGTRQARDDVGVESRAVDEPLRPHGEAGGGELKAGARPRARRGGGPAIECAPRGPELERGGVTDLA